MNEQLEFDKSETILVCMKDGKFLNEEGDGHATWINLTTSILRAKIFHPVWVYGSNADWDKSWEVDEIRLPEYYQKWPEIPVGARMVKLKVNSTGWLKGQGPIQPKKENWIVDNPFYKEMLKKDPTIR